ncbi:GNAT family N-acetyltransferase [Jatrophihabitans fulvus]
MPLELRTPDGTDLVRIVDVLGSWQRDDAPLQLHPGDVGWFTRFGAAATARAVRIWVRDGEPMAIGLLDGADILRLTVAPASWDDDELAARVVSDVSDPGAGVFTAGPVSIEAPDGCRVREALDESGWTTGEPWTPLRRDLSRPVGGPGVRTEVVDDATVDDYAAVLASAFGTPPFPDSARALHDGPLAGSARSLLARDEHGAAAAAITVWSAGPGRPGLIEPLAVHVDHRGRGLGSAMCRAGAAVLQETGASSVLVCTPSALTGAVATYRSAGFERLPERLDRTRDLSR